MILEPEPGARPFLVQRLGAAGVNNQTCALSARHRWHGMALMNSLRTIFRTPRSKKGFPRIASISSPLVVDIGLPYPRTLSHVITCECQNCGISMSVKRLRVHFFPMSRHSAHSELAGQCLGDWWVEKTSASVF